MNADAKRKAIWQITPAMRKIGNSSVFLVQIRSKSRPNKKSDRISHEAFARGKSVDSTKASAKSSPTTRTEKDEQYDLQTKIRIERLNRLFGGFFVGM